MNFWRCTSIEETPALRFLELKALAFMNRESSREIVWLDWFADRPTSLGKSYIIQPQLSLIAEGRKKTDIWAFTWVDRGTTILGFVQ